MLKLKAFVLGLTAVFVVPDVARAYITPRVRDLLREKRQEYDALQQCAAKVNGFKIAGISTLGLTAAGVAGNVALANKRKDVQDLIDNPNKIKSNNTLDNLVYNGYTAIGNSCEDVFIFKQGEAYGSNINSLYSSITSASSPTLNFCMSSPTGNENNIKNASNAGVNSSIRQLCSLNTNVAFDYVYASSDSDCKCPGGFKTCHLGTTIIGTVTSTTTTSTSGVGGTVTPQTTAQQANQQQKQTQEPLMRMEVKKAAEIAAGLQQSGNAPQFQLRDTSTNSTPAAQNTNDNTGSAIYNQLSL